MSASAARTIQAKETSDPGQATLDRFGMDIAEYRTIWEYWKEDHWPLEDVYFTGEALFTTDYDTVSLTVSPSGTTPRDKASPASHQQSLEANLMANNDRETVDDIIEALHDMQPYLVLDTEGREGLPLRQQFEIAGTPFYIDRAPEGRDLPPHRFPATKYIERRQTPQNGDEIHQSAVYDNLDGPERVLFDYTISRLKELDVPLYAVGGVTASSDYDDIDIAVDVSVTETDSLISNHRLSPLEQRLERLAGADIEKITHESVHTGSWQFKYGSLTKRYRFPVQSDGVKTVFDVGAMNNPFVDNPDRVYAKL